MFKPSLLALTMPLVRITAKCCDKLAFLIFNISRSLPADNSLSRKVFMISILLGLARVLQISACISYRCFIVAIIVNYGEVACQGEGKGCFLRQLKLPMIE